jgi:two-component system nitrogen regulation sensor histidine kinase GlnL
MSGVLMSPSSSNTPAPAAVRRTTGTVKRLGDKRSAPLSDRFFRHMVLNLRNGVLAISRDGRIAAMNEVAYRVLGLRARDTDLGQPYADVLQECPEVVRVLQSAFDTSDLPNRAELRLRKTGRALGYTISHIYDDDGAQVGLTLFFKDLTRVEQMEERERLRDRLATLGQMAAAIAHEVKNPLASIEVMAGVLRRQLTDRPEAMETLDDIIKESKMANAIVVEVLAFVKPIRLQVEHVDIREVIQDAIQGLDEGAPAVHVQVDAAVPLLTADPNQLRQLFTNLITNALEAMDVTVGERRVEIHASLVSEDAEPASAGLPLPAQICIEVKDNGPGISEDVLERIFSPFFTTKSQGTGLGLSIVRKVVDAHDGIIAATSALGRGTTFQVTLPVVPAPGYLTEHLHGTYSRR